VGRCPGINLCGAITFACSLDLCILNLDSDRLTRLISQHEKSINRLTTTTDPRKKQTIQDYNGLGRVESITDRNHHTKTFAYNINDNLLAETWDDGRAIFFGGDR
jgi:YD repeat-containing protein